MTIQIKCLAPRPMASLRLLCIPFAGAGASAFRDWPALLPAHVEAYAVQLPGREERLRTPPLTSWQPMMEQLVAATAPLTNLPLAVFGHSLGAVIGLELARWLHVHHRGCLHQLFAAARPWPGATRGKPEQHAATLPDAALLLLLQQRFGSLSTSLAHPEIRAMALPVLRADLHLLDSYRYVPAPALECPLTVFAGTADPATDATALAGWRQETNAAFRVAMFDGGHFFLESQRTSLLAEIAASLRGDQPTAEPHQPRTPVRAAPAATG